MASASTDASPLSGKDVAEDTDAPSDMFEGKSEATSLWLRVLGLGIFALSVCLIGYGLIFIQPALNEAKMLARHKHDPVGTELTFKPKDEVRRFEFATLPNGLQAVTVHDSRALQKGFAVGVQAGSFDDPESLPGLAHFCEHMVFLGTKRFPDPTSFDNFVAANGGKDNAMTSSENTVYYAGVAQKAAEEGLDRYADFFRAPLFTETYVDKEVHAIDSEFQKNAQTNMRQILAILFSIADPHSPVSNFGSGNYETLKTNPEKMNPPVDNVAALKVFFKSHYCPSRMKVVTVGSETNAEQLKQIQKRFGNLEAQDESCKAPWAKHDSPKAFTPDRLQKWINVQGSLPRSYLWIHFPLPDESRQYMSEPFDYIQYVLAYSGEDSLARVLKDTLGLATGMEVMFDETSAGTQLVFAIQMTAQGRENEMLILDVLFAYLAALNQEGVNQGLYNSLVAVQKLKWDWAGQQTPSETAKDLAERMTRVKLTDVLWADSLILKPDVGLVKSLLAKLTPQNMNVASVRKKAKSQEETDKLFKGQQIKVLPRFDISHSIQPLKAVAGDHIHKWDQWVSGKVPATDIQKSIKEEVAQLKLAVIPARAILPKSPKQILGIPDTLKFQNMHAAYVPYSPELLIDTLLYGPTAETLRFPIHNPYGKDAEIWYRSGWMVPSPKVKLKITLNPLKLPGASEMGPLQDLQLELYGRLLAEEMSPKLVDFTATDASYKISVGSGGGGIDFELDGFEPSMQDLITSITTEFNAFNRNATITPEVRWNRVCHQLKEDLTTYSDMSLNYAVADRNLLLTKGSHHRDELVEVLEKSPPTLRSSSTSVSDLFLSKPLRLTALAMGNIAKDQALEKIGNFMHSIEYPCDGGKPCSAAAAKAGQEDAEVERVTPIVNLQQTVEVRKQNPREGDKNDVVVVSVVSGLSTVESRVILGLISSLYKPMAYNTLRTEQQLGYVVTAGVVLISNVHLISCVAQGDRIDADAMEAAVQHVNLDLMPKRLEALTDKEFRAYKESFRSSLLQPPMSLKSEFDHFAGPVHQGGIGFDLLNEMLRFIDGPLLTKEALQAEWQRLMTPKEATRNMLVVKYFAKKEATAPRTLAQANQTWSQNNVSKESMQRLEREFKSNTILSKVDSTERKKLAKTNGWFSTKQQLKLHEPEKSASDKPIQVPQQLIDLAEERRQEIQTFRSMQTNYGPDDVVKRLVKTARSHLRSSSRRGGSVLAPED